MPQKDEGSATSHQVLYSPQPMLPVVLAQHPPMLEQQFLKAGDYETVVLRTWRSLVQEALLHENTAPAELFPTTTGQTGPGQLQPQCRK
jgi:hypothetical protein